MTIKIKKEEEEQKQKNKKTFNIGKVEIKIQ